MSQSAKAVVSTSSALSAHQVAEYLLEHPDFFYQFPHLVEFLQVPHPTTGRSVSLLERQIFQLRERNQQIQTDVDSYIFNATNNIEIAKKVQGFAVSLMEAKDVQEAVDIILEEMKLRFAVKHVMLHSFEMPSQGIVGISQLGLTSKWANAIKLALAPMKPHCGMVELEWRKGVFPKVDTIESICLLPLGSEKVWGILALGSEDNRFEPHDTYFLKFLCQIMTAKLEALFVR